LDRFWDIGKKGPSCRSGALGKDREIAGTVTKDKAGKKNADRIEEMFHCWDLGATARNTDETQMLRKGKKERSDQVSRSRRTFQGMANGSPP